MRDPERIDEILDLVREVWTQEPDLRLAQLIFNAARFEQENLKDVYNIEDSPLRKGLTRYLKHITEQRRSPS